MCAQIGQKLNSNNMFFFFLLRNKLNDWRETVKDMYFTIMSSDSQDWSTINHNAELKWSSYLSAQRKESCRIHVWKHCNMTMLCRHFIYLRTESYCVWNIVRSNVFNLIIYWYFMFYLFILCFNMSYLSHFCSIWVKILSYYPPFGGIS